MEITDLQIQELIAEAKEDEVGLWFVIAMVRSELGISGPDQVHKSTMSCVQRLLESSEVEAGHYKSDGTGIEIWRMSDREIISRIESEWEALGREPNIGEIVLFIGCR